MVAELRKHGIEIEPVKNKQEKISGVRFCYKGETFKVSEVGRGFGFRSMFNHFGQMLEGQNGTPFIPKYHNEPQPMINTIVDAAVNTIAEVASNSISIAGEAASTIGGLFDIQPSGYDANEADYLYQQSQEKKKKKKRGRKM